MRLRHGRVGSQGLLSFTLSLTQKGVASIDDGFGRRLQAVNRGERLAEVSEGIGRIFSQSLVELLVCSIELELHGERQSQSGHCIDVTRIALDFPAEESLCLGVLSLLQKVLA